MESHVECGGSGNSTKQSQGAKRPGSAILSLRSKRSLTLPSFSGSEALRDDEISDYLMLGSEEETDSEEEDEELSRFAPVPRVARLFLGAEGVYEGDTNEAIDNAQLCHDWPPRPRSASLMPISDPEPRAVPDSTVGSTPIGPLDKFEFIWRGFPQPNIPPKLRREPFNNIDCGPTVQLASPYDAFTAIWDREIMAYIATQTNAYAQQVAASMLADGTICPRSRITKWHDTDADELYVFFAIILATGITVKTRLDEYWNAGNDIFSTPGYSVLMPYARFILLNKCLHFVDNKVFPVTPIINKSMAKLFKIQPIIDHLNGKFQLLYNLSQNIALDESLTMWKGWLNINQFIRNKAAKVGIKTYEVCESHTGYLWRFEVHAGHEDVNATENNPTSGIIPTIVLRLLSGLEHKGHTAWMDNFYNSPALARELKCRGFDCVGTLRTNRQFVPLELVSLQKEDMAAGQLVGCTSGDVDLMVWRDKNWVALISTYHGLETVKCGDTLKPSIVPDYNICMGGVDRKDQMLAMYPIERRRTKVWYKKFFRRLLNASTLNAYILYKAQYTTTHRTFRKTLVRQLLSKHHTPPSPSPAHVLPSAGHFPGQYGFTSDKQHERLRRVCVVCKKRSTSFCKLCNMTLCVFTCFEKYHTTQ